MKPIYTYQTRLINIFISILTYDSQKLMGILVGYWTFHFFVDLYLKLKGAAVRETLVVTMYILLLYVNQMCAINNCG